MRKVWVVVANSCESKIYHCNANKLVELKSFVHEEGHLHAKDIVSDKKGRNTERGVYGSDTMEEKTPLKLKEADQFAHKIGKFLEEGWNSKAFERLYVIAKPPFLSNLRHSLSDHVSSAIHSEIHKDLIHMRPDEIREYLPLVL